MSYLALADFLALAITPDKPGASDVIWLNRHRIRPVVRAEIRNEDSRSVRTEALVRAAIRAVAQQRNVTVSRTGPPVSHRGGARRAGFHPIDGYTRNRHFPRLLGT